MTGMAAKYDTRFWSAHSNVGGACASSHDSSANMNTAAAVSFAYVCAALSSLLGVFCLRAIISISLISLIGIIIMQLNSTLTGERRHP